MNKLQRSKDGGLEENEKRIVKYLLLQGWRNQDIQAYINMFRKKTVNGARVSGVKNSPNILAASKEEFEQFDKIKKSYNPSNGLNPFFDERLIKARESMLLAVAVFNNPTTFFKAEVFSVLAIIAWTNLFHEFCHRNGYDYVQKNGKTSSLGYLLGRDFNPLSEAATENLKDIIEIRDNVEHRKTGEIDKKWHTLFQANALNFNNSLEKLFGPEVSLTTELGFALQFSKLTASHTNQVSRYDIPEEILAFDISLRAKHDSGILVNNEYSAHISYSLGNVGDDDSVKYIGIPVDDHEVYNLRASDVWKEVSKQSNNRFTSTNHTQAYILHNVRPRSKTNSHRDCNSSFCKYYPAFKDYRYSNDWVDFLIGEISDEAKFSEIKSVKL